jgi:transposase
VRVFAIGNGRKTDPVDAHSVALAAVRAPGLARVVVDDDLLVMGMLADRREEFGRARTQTVNRLHRFLLDLFPVARNNSRPPSRHGRWSRRSNLATWSATRRLVVELIVELEAMDKKMKTLKNKCGPLLAGVGDIYRFADRDKVASWNGTAPLDASSGKQERHRLSRAGGRGINRALHIMAVVRLRNPD